MRTRIRTAALVILAIIAPVAAGLVSGVASAAPDPLVNHPPQIPESLLLEPTPNLVQNQVLVKGIVTSLGVLSSQEAHIAALAWPQHQGEEQVGAQSRWIPLTHGVVDANGSFELAYPLQRLPKDALTKDGEVDLHLIAWTGSGSSTSFDMTVAVDRKLNKFHGYGSTSSDDNPSAVMSGEARDYATEPQLRLMEFTTCTITLLDQFTTWVTVGDGFPAVTGSQKSGFDFSSSETVCLSRHWRKC